MYLAHFGYNMWLEPMVDEKGIHYLDPSLIWSPYVNATDYLRFEEDYWKELTVQLKAAGCNTIVLDVGEGVRFDSYPELAIKGSWSKQKFSDELDRLRHMGFEVLPKLNFSACHDQWMGEYGRMLSTSVYYRVTRDLIAETAELFDHPRMFHLGMDEETAQNQEKFNFTIVRQGEQWWYDFNKLAQATEAAGCRPWIWSDYGWYHEEFFQNMSREVVQSNFYYGDFREEDWVYPVIPLYQRLEEAGFDQVPAGSNWSFPDNLSRTVRECGRFFSPEHLIGYMQTPWLPTMRETSKVHDGAIADIRTAIACYYEN